MNLYIVETQNFEFKCFAQDIKEFEEIMKKAWKQHCQSFQIEFDENYLKEIISDVNAWPIVSGGVFRDNSLIYQGE